MTISNTNRGREEEINSGLGHKHASPAHGPSNPAAGTGTTAEELRRTSAAENQKMETCIQAMKKFIKTMKSTTMLQKNFNRTINKGLPKLEEALNSLAESRRPL